MKAINLVPTCSEFYAFLPLQPSKSQHLHSPSLIKPGTGNLLTKSSKSGNMFRSTHILKWERRAVAVNNKFYNSLSEEFLIEFFCFQLET